MKNRYLVLGITGVLALALAVPALGGPSNPIASSAAKSKNLAKRALNAANAAQASADKAQTTANTAQTTANTAKTTADKAVADAAAAKTLAESKLGGTFTNSGETSPSDANSPKTVQGTCAAGKLTGGGYLISGANANDITTSQSFPYGSLWQVTAEEGDAVATNWSVVNLVQCAG